MPVMVDEVRKLATIERITDIRPVEGADALDQAAVRLWSVVIRKDEGFQVGDLVVFFEIDTALPVGDERFARFAPRGVKRDGDREYHVLKTARLRGVYSQGLVLPYEMFAADIEQHFTSLGEDFTPEVGADVTAALGLGKWEAPVVASGNGQAKGTFLTQYARKTDSERLQNLSGAWELIKNTEWFATEKVDGTSCTVIRDENGELRVCSRNLEVRNEGENVYWDTVHRFAHLFEDMPNNSAVQMEIAGPGICGNRLGLNSFRPFIFDVVHQGEMVGMDHWEKKLLSMASPVLDITLPGTPQELIDMVDGMKSVVAPNRLAEGVVFHTKDGSCLRALGDRNTFKVISAKYLSKEK